jgi:hypothetical protein
MSCWTASPAHRSTIASYRGAGVMSCWCQLSNGWVEAARIRTPARAAAPAASARVVTSSARSSDRVVQTSVADSSCVVVISACRCRPASCRSTAMARAGLRVSR